MRTTVLWMALLAAPVCAQSLTEEGFSHFYNLENDEAIASFEKAIAQNPSLPDPHNHLAQTPTFLEMFPQRAVQSELGAGNNSFLRQPKLNPPSQVEKLVLDEIAKSM